jgi:hypothetical protein
MNKRFSTYMFYNWYYYIVYAIIVIFFWILLFTNLGAAKDNEKISIFLGTYDVDRVELTALIEDSLRDTIIKEINVDSSYDKGNQFGYIFATRGMVNTDILILNENYVREEDFSIYFKALDLFIIEKYLPTDVKHSYLEYDDKVYGILVYSEEENVNVLADIISYNNEENNDRYYLFLNKSSKNLGEMNNETISYDDNLALKVINILLDNKEEE